MSHFEPFFESTNLTSFSTPFPSPQVSETDVIPLLNTVSKAMREAQMKSLDDGNDEKVCFATIMYMLVVFVFNSVMFDRLLKIYLVQNDVSVNLCVFYCCVLFLFIFSQVEVFRKRKRVQKRHMLRKYLKNGEGGGGGGGEGGGDSGSEEE